MSEFLRTSENDSKYYKHIPIETLKKKWGIKKNVKDIQDIHFSKDEPLTTTSDDIEKYAEKVEKEFHKERKESWLKGYIQNYISRNPKDNDLYEI